jgi:hypothetical protein
MTALEAVIGNTVSLVVFEFMAGSKACGIEPDGQLS